MTTALAEALARRGRTWGAGNDAVLAEMRASFTPGPNEEGRASRRTGPWLSSTNERDEQHHVFATFTSYVDRERHASRARAKARYHRRKARA